MATPRSTRLAAEEPTAARRADARDATRPPSRDRFRANAALTVAWAALAVIAVAYAIARGSVGAALLAAFIAWLLRVAWKAALRPDDDHDPDDHDQITLLP